MCLTTAPNVYSICHIDPQYLHFATHTTQVIIYAERGNGSMTFAFSVTLCLQPSSYQSSFHFVFWQQTSQTLLLVLWPLTPPLCKPSRTKSSFKKGTSYFMGFMGLQRAFMNIKMTSLNFILFPIHFLLHNDQTRLTCLKASQGSLPSINKLANYIIM